MKHRNSYIKAILVIALLLGGGVFIQAQEIENDFQARTNVQIKYDPLKKLSLSVSPEVRFDESFSTDVYLLETKVKYKVLEFLSLNGIYRFAINPRENKGTEYLNRFSVGAVAQKKIGRFKPGFRLRYTDDADDATSDEQFLRYKAFVSYNIKNCKATPYVAAEAFHQLGDNLLYKMRYTAGLEYKLFKKNYLDLSYKFDYYQTEYKNKHIVTLGYKFKF